MAKVGRPMVYKSAKALKDAVERYFNSISRTATVTDPMGEPLLNDNGEELQTIRYVRPPALSSLCLALGIDKKTWINYGDPDLHPDFAPIVSWARGFMEAYLEEELNTRDKVSGIIFNLTNNYGWRQKNEVELGEETRKVASPTLSLSEKLAAISAAQAALAAQDNGEDAGDDD